MLRAGVIGDPVAHSRSPVLHNAAFASLGINARYELSHTISRLLRIHTGIDMQWGPVSEQFVIPSLDTGDSPGNAGR